MQPQRILITGARAPAALELCRAFSAAGHTVFASDSLREPLCRHSRAVERFFRIPEPRSNLRGFADSLEQLLASQEIDLLVPTCEEVFFVARVRAQLEIAGARVLADDFEKLRSLHDKFEFTKMATDCGAEIPETFMLDSVEDPRRWVFKPVFSRFGSDTLIRPSANELAEARLADPGRAWVAQQPISGEEHCTFGLALGGQLVAHACYRPAVRLRRGSGIFFEPAEVPAIEEFVTKFVEKHQFTGQIGFDFMVSDSGGVTVLECNPRATSGVHFFENQPDELANSFLGRRQQLLTPRGTEPKMIGLAMAAFLHQTVSRHGLSHVWRHWRVGQDVIGSPLDPWPLWHQSVSLGEIVVRALRGRRGLKQAATADIEWNGEPLELE